MLRQLALFMATYLAFDGPRFVVVTIRRRTKSSPWRRSLCAIPTSDASPLGQVLLPLGFSNFHLLLLATTAELIGLELAFGLELVAAMFGDVAFSHFEGC